VIPQALLLMLRISDELVPVYIVLRTPFVDESTLNAYLARLAINLESFALSTAPASESGEAGAQPQKELIFSETIKDSHGSFFVSRETDTESYTYVIWKIDVFICKQGQFVKSRYAE
jgi:hypothetical protein